MVQELVQDLDQELVQVLVQKLVQERLPSLGQPRWRPPARRAFIASGWRRC